MPESSYMHMLFKCASSILGSLEDSLEMVEFLLRTFSLLCHIEVRFIGISSLVLS